jgi:anthranilate 1,2-dioxygenase small subunit
MDQAAADLVAIERAVAALHARYVAIIDEGRLEEWPALFVEAGRYEITTRDNLANNYPIGVVYCDTRAMMVDRVTAARRILVYEPHLYRHVGGYLTVEPDSAGRYRATSHFHVFRIMQSGDFRPFACGVFRDVITFAHAAPLFESRQVVLDSPNIDTGLVIPL